MIKPDTKKMPNILLHTDQCSAALHTGRWAEALAFKLSRELDIELRNAENFRWYR